MPELSRFYGIIIRMFYGDHAPPHFHAVYQGEEIQININTLEVMEGDMRRRARALVLVLDCKNKRYIRWPFGRLALLLARHSPLRGCSSLAPCHPPKWPAGYIAYFCNQALEWAALHRAELRQAWEAASHNEEPFKIAPLE